MKDAGETVPDDPGGPSRLPRVPVRERPEGECSHRCGDSSRDGSNATSGRYCHSQAEQQAASGAWILF